MIVFVTGAATGIGRATGERLRRQGCGLALFDIDEAAITAPATELGSRVLAFGGSLTDLKRLEEAMTEAVRRFGLCATKVAVLNFAEAYRTEMRGYGVEVGTSTRLHPHRAGSTDALEPYRIVPHGTSRLLTTMATSPHMMEQTRTTGWEETRPGGEDRMSPPPSVATVSKVADRIALRSGFPFGSSVRSRSGPGSFVWTHARQCCDGRLVTGSS